MRILKRQEIDLKAQEYVRNIRRSLVAFNPACHPDLLDRTIHELVILRNETNGEFTFEEPAHASAG